MRKHAVTAALALTLVAGLATAPGWVASADEGDGSHPSRADVRDARQAADDKAGEVAAVQARLAEAQGRLQDSAVRVAQAEEAFNRARWLYREARRKQRGPSRPRRPRRHSSGRCATSTPTSSWRRTRCRPR